VILVLLFLTTFTTLISELRRLSLPSAVTESASQQIIQLQAEHAALVTHQEILSRQIADKDASIHHLQVASTISPTETNIPPSTVTNTFINFTSQNLRNTPPHPRTRSSRSSSIGVPYPPPFTPPRTPDEERRNSIIAWVNEIRKQAKTQ
jgi:hypothetical protein